ncbi:hypothetical protein UCDDS831_g03162 [Diplodia seriata]|uniref:Uncharacterized protein n=1 Tax=Diplodia seriata TaxID=420778 RepID=A0A0G2GI19_9PEZI|nr:hypothetical protein UCDDS831_g03162 [Diplodia seriata]
MTSHIPRTCERLTVVFGSYDGEQRSSNNNNNNNAPTTVSPPLDHFSLGLREVSTRLRWIALRHVPVSSTLFWPDPRESAPQEEPWWPHLETFRISFAKLDPFGT